MKNGCLIGLGCCMLSLALSIIGIRWAVIETKEMVARVSVSLTQSP